MPVPKGTRVGGRKKGTPNKATADIKEAARRHGPAMIDELARIALRSDSDAARVSAIKEVLDRGYGKSPQPIDATIRQVPVNEMDEAELDRRIALALAGEEKAGRVPPVTH